MKKPIVIIGIGEIGSVIGRGYLRLGHPVYPVTRHQSIAEATKAIPDPESVVVAVGENDLHTTLDQIPADWRDRLILIQNELLPRDWQQHGLGNPTVASIWFEKKKGQDSKVVVPTIVCGPHASGLKQALAELDIPATEVDSEERLLFELVRKNLYILTTNIAGLKTGGTVSELWRDHQDVAKAVATDVLAIQQLLTEKTLDEEALLRAMLIAFEGDPDHGCMGRSAPARLQRALQIADQTGLDVPTLREIATQHLDN